MNKPEIIIKEDKLADAILVAQQIPEFENGYKIDDYQNRLHGKNKLILTAYINNQPVGFKIGYETNTKHHFYSWMGGVLPSSRNLGIAEKLSKFQENWALNTEYKSILIKTRTKHVAMRKFLNKHFFVKIATTPFIPEEETRLIYEKQLLQK